ncbi:hypothetical protein CYMTET_19428 [Cymbomonas tetramitiformis]|uniref:Uncharacterized protein n=1 Tax=Cymbomonas tetramitiformis TaxID=36881 RepID=A0AAE0G6L8_9CHLO|nr:hypothetical protein CYMTET_19428 [Cymbomonas tetramitiformis]
MTNMPTSTGSACTNKKPRKKRSKRSRDAIPVETNTKESSEGEDPDGQHLSDAEVQEQEDHAEDDGELDSWQMVRRDNSMNCLDTMIGGEVLLTRATEGWETVSSGKKSKSTREAKYTGANSARQEAPSKTQTQKKNEKRRQKRELVNELQRTSDTRPRPVLNVHKLPGESNIPGSYGS